MLNKVIEGLLCCLVCELPIITNVFLFHTNCPRTKTLQLLESSVFANNCVKIFYFSFHKYLQFYYNKVPYQSKPFPYAGLAQLVYNALSNKKDPFTRVSLIIWCRMSDLNQRPTHYECRIHHCLYNKESLKKSLLCTTHYSSEVPSIILMLLANFL